jgi:hypothetical protein
MRLLPFPEPVEPIPVVALLTHDADFWAADAIDGLPWEAPENLPDDLPGCAVPVIDTDYLDLARPGAYAVVVPPWFAGDSGYGVTLAGGRNRVRRWDGEGTEPGPVVGKVIGMVRMFE